MTPASLLPASGRGGYDGRYDYERQRSYDRTRRGRDYGYDPRRRRGYYYKEVYQSPPNY